MQSTDKHTYSKTDIKFLYKKDIQITKSTES